MTKKIVYLSELPFESILPGTQVLYLPGHVGEDLGHKDVEEGFVTSVRDTGEDRIAFVRFFRKRGTDYDLYTRSSSASCNLDRLILGGNRDQARINELASECLMQSNLYWKPGMASSVPMTQDQEQGADPGIS